MPKVIDNLKNKYMVVGRAVLMSKGYKALTLRMVAKECNVAVGTVYNYFKNKDELVASIMAVDWIELLNETRKKCEKSKNENNGIELIYRMIRKFSDKYSFVWRESKQATISQEKHIVLVDQTSELIQIVLKRKDKKLARFISELLIAYGIRDVDEYKDIKKYIAKIIG